MVVFAPFETARRIFSQLSKSGTDDAEKDAALVEKAR